ncbi:MAG: GIY-YIG nuclease family protein [Candidatus Moranbacteria bacterium]|nr:GIY-YIG nuclease family protein [Candidatus Moranbacteria bacterium]
MDKKDLLDLINDDDLGLLDIEKKSTSATPDDRLTESFMEINDFFSSHGVEPKSGGDIHEHKLASRLKHIRENKEQVEFLSKFDTYNLLKTTSKEIDTVSDIFEDDDLDLLSIEDSSVFKIKNVPEIRQDRSDPDFVAQREICADFDQYKHLFEQVQRELKSGTKKLSTFVESEMKQGDFFVLNGVLIYLEKVFDPYRGNSQKINRRTRCIYENGTESNVLLRSLGKRLSDAGYAVKDNPDVVSVEDGDSETGFIYVLKSLSDNPRISNTKNLFKIGFSTTSVEERIKNAEQDPTYLMAPVSIVATYRCFNMNPQRFERLIHRFFNDSCLDIEIIDNNGKNYTPREWFIAPIMVVSEAIELIIKGEIVNYTYDREKETIIKAN